MQVLCALQHPSEQLCEGKKCGTVMLMVTGQIFSIVHHPQLELDFKAAEILPVFRYCLSKHIQIPRGLQHFGC